MKHSWLNTFMCCYLATIDDANDTAAVHHTYDPPVNVCIFEQVPEKPQY